MSRHFDREQITAIAAALQEPSRGVVGPVRMMTEIAKEGWMAPWLLDDILYATDRRLLKFPHGVDVEAIARMLDLNSVSVTQRPRATSNGAMLHAAWSNWDAAALFIWLEAAGFQIDPQPLIERLRSDLPKRGLITASQLAVLWYDKERGKRCIEISAADRAAPQEVERLKLATGHKLEIWRDAEQKAVRLRIAGPKHRLRRDPVETTCSDCAYVWYRGDPDSSAGHRREHRERMVFLDPQPDANMLAARATDPKPERVTWLSPDWKQKAMDDRALIFRRELGYSFVGWGARAERDTKAEGYLFADNTGAIVGACAFRWREYPDAPAGWALQWVWVCPKARRQGVLRTRWKEFRERYGAFDIEAPVSPVMQAFVRAMGDGGLLGPQTDPADEREVDL